jgi:hypothetical protein
MTGRELIKQLVESIKDLDQEITVSCRAGMQELPVEFLTVTETILTIRLHMYSLTYTSIQECGNHTRYSMRMEVSNAQRY